MKMETRINYHHTDAIGIVYHASYLNFLEEARTEYLESKGISLEKMHAKGKFLVVNELKGSYKNPARFGELIVCESSIDRMTSAQIFFSQKIYNKQNNQLLIDAQVGVVLVNEILSPILISEYFAPLLYENAELI